MSWIRTILTASAFATGLVLSAAASAAIVVASSGPSAAQYPVGKKLADTDRITLRAGDSVTVLDKRGTKVLRGPGRPAISQPGRLLPNPAFALLTRKDAANRSGTAAVRNGHDGQPLAPNLWLVDLGRPGSKCVTAPDRVWLWRADARKAARYRLVAPTDRPPSNGIVSFSAGTTTADWTVGPVVEGKGYVVAAEGGGEITITFAIIAEPPANAEDLALALIDKGCMAQLELLSDTLAISLF